MMGGGYNFGAPGQGSGGGMGFVLAVVLLLVGGLALIFWAFMP
jgi:hypothetical protein